VAKSGSARVAFPIVNGKETGDCGRMVCSLVALDSLVRGSRGHLGPYAAHLSLLKRKDKATHVCLERAMFNVLGTDVRTQGDVVQRIYVRGIV
jgi:hypothetical protein